MTQQLLIQHSSEDDEYYFREGCHILEYLNHASDPELSIARARVAPGKHTRKHALRNTVERYLILQGCGEVTIDQQTSVLQLGSTAVIPAGSSQCIRNTGQQELVFLAVCTPRFQLENYLDLEDDL